MSGWWERTYRVFEDSVRPADKLRRLEDILGKYASNRGWDYMEIGDEEPR